MPRFVVFWTTSTIKDEKSPAKFHYIKNVSGKVVAHSIAFRVVPAFLRMRSENMVKIALNAVRLPKFESVNGISWSPRKIMVKDLRQRSGLA